jgi:hypothetical protein
VICEVKQAKGYKETTARSCTPFARGNRGAAARASKGVREGRVRASGSGWYGWGFYENRAELYFAHQS